MFIAMNRFRVLKGSEEAFEEMWRNRESFLKEVPGFQQFHLLRGPESEEHVLYASHTLWASRDDFEGWTKSEQFRKAHAQAGQSKVQYAGPPQFEGFDPVEGCAVVV